MTVVGSAESYCMTDPIVYPPFPQSQHILVHTQAYWRKEVPYPTKVRSIKGKTHVIMIIAIALS